MITKLKAIIVKGNPKFINNSMARKYYRDIELFLKENGATSVEFDEGDDGTLPKLDADIYIGHSRGCSRRMYMPVDKQKVFLRFGDPKGIIDPTDLEWHNNFGKKGVSPNPPKEHFLFIDKQKEAILKLIKRVKTKIAKEDLCIKIPIYSCW